MRKLPANAERQQPSGDTPRARAISDRAAQGAASAVSRAALNRALDATGDAVFFLTLDEVIVEVNAAAIGGSGYLRSELQAMSFGAVIADAGDGRLRESLERLRQRETLEDVAAALHLTKTGGSQAVQVQLQRVDEGGESFLVAVVERSIAAEQLSEVVSRADEDFLTGLPSRSALERRLRQTEAHARRSRGRFAVLFIDLDRFKAINETRGHRAGDLVLRKCGRRLRACMRPGDFVARYGGDEFVAVVEDVRSDDQVEQIARRIGRALARPLRVAKSELRISASVGTAIGHALSSADAVVHEADLAMYRAKRSGRADEAGKNT